MKLALVTPHYPPDGGPSAPLFAMLAKELRARGHQVTVVAAHPHYPSGSPPPGWVASRRTIEVVDGVEVVRVPVPRVDRRQLTKRLVQFASYQFGAALAVARRRFDGVVASGPALQTALPFLLAARRSGKTVFSVHDLYPQVGIDLGVFRHPLVIGAIRWLELRCLTTAGAVRYLAPAFRSALADLGVRAEKLHFIPDWVDTDFIDPRARNNAFAIEHGLCDKFVVLYAGNIGISQGLDSVVEAAGVLRDHRHIHFLFVGDGVGRADLERTARQRGLSSVSFVEYQPRARLPDVLATADLGLVCLRRGFAGSLPSKVYSHLASGRPVLAAVDPGGNVAAVVRQAGAGRVVTPEDPRALAEAILDYSCLSIAERAELGRRGRNYAEMHHSPAAAASAFETLLDQTGSRRSGPISNSATRQLS